MTTRSPSHAGSWYSDHAPTLSKQLQSWLDAVPNPLEDVGPLPPPGARVIIAPHAGYSYSGPAAAWAYKCLDLSKCKRIFLLGPSHHLPLPTLALPHPYLKTYTTPLGPIPLDHTTLSALRSTQEFSILQLENDEDEHSLEMHLPYIHHLSSSLHPPTSTSTSTSTSPQEPSEQTTSMPALVPILVGSTTQAMEQKYGKLLSPYLADESNIFIISSDFCHWGLRFQYTYYQPSPPSPSSSQSPSSSSQKPKPMNLSKKSHPPPTNPAIHESIRHTDSLCMHAVESGSHAAFLNILKETGNTVCGRHPIGVVMAAVEVLRAAGGVGGGVGGGAEGIEGGKGKVEGEGTGGGEEQGEGEGKEGEGKGERWGKFKFVRYERSSLVKAVRDSSVSYASAFAVL